MNEMSDRQNILGQRILESLKYAQAYHDRLGKTNSRLSLTSLASSAAATLVAGVTAVGGPLVGEGIPGWRLACSVAALLGFIATLATGFHQQLKLDERQTLGNQCIGRLKALEVSLATQRKSWDEIGAEYEDITRNYPEWIR